MLWCHADFKNIALLEHYELNTVATELTSDG